MLIFFNKKFQQTRLGDNIFLRLEKINEFEINQKLENEKISSSAKSKKERKNR